MTALLAPFLLRRSHIHLHLFFVGYLKSFEKKLSLSLFSAIATLYNRLCLLPLQVVVYQYCSTVLLINMDLKKETKIQKKGRFHSRWCRCHHHSALGRLFFLFEFDRDLKMLERSILDIYDSMGNFWDLILHTWYQIWFLCAYFTTLEITIYFRTRCLASSAQKQLQYCSSIK